MRTTPRPSGRLIFSRALHQAQIFDGSEAALDRLTGAIAAFENFAGPAPAGRTRNQHESIVIRSLDGKTPYETVQDVLQLAIDTLGRDLHAGRRRLRVQPTPYVFLPTDGQPIAEGGGGKIGTAAAQSTPRQTIRVVQALVAGGCPLDRMRIYGGDAQLACDRYTLIVLPDHDREVLVSDKPHNATFVGKGVRGPLFWASYNKEQLQGFDDITRIVSVPGFETRVAQAVTQDNPAQPKAPRPGKVGWPLSYELILTHALRHYERTGNLPGHDARAVASLPGQTWKGWESAIRDGSRGLERDDLHGVSHLLRLSGLRHGQTTNHEAAQEALDRLNATGRHGLTPAPKQSLSEDSLIAASLEHAVANGYQLPTVISGPIEALPGYSWAGAHNSLRYRRDGLTREGLRGLAHLHKLYGLKQGTQVNRKRIDNALASLASTGHHGLTPGRLEEPKLTADYLITQALKHAAANEMKLPTVRSGELPDLPGRTWSGADDAVRVCQRGFEMPGVRGIGHLFRIYALKALRTDNHARIAAAATRLEQTGHHGLTPCASAQGCLTEIERARVAKPAGLHPGA